MRKVPESLYPFTSHWFDIDGLRLHYLDEGRGHPVVMVHGNPTWSFYYRDLIRALARSFRAVAVDHMGCGFSDKPGDGQYQYTMQRRVHDFTALMEHLAFESLDLVVHDWGGPIGLSWAVKNVQRVRRLVILNTCGFTAPKGKSVPWQLALARSPLGTALVQGGNLFARGATRMAVRKTSMPREVRDAYCAPYDSWHNRIATLRFVQDAPATPRDRSYPDLEALGQSIHLLAHTPALVCWGDKDFVFDHLFFERWREVLPEAEFHRFPEGGHYILEDEGERVIPLIEAFLSAPPKDRAEA